MRRRRTRNNENVISRSARSAGGRSVRSSVDRLTTDQCDAVPAAGPDTTSEMAGEIVMTPSVIYTRRRRRPRSLSSSLIFNYLAAAASEKAHFRPTDRLADRPTVMARRVGPAAAVVEATRSAWSVHVRSIDQDHPNYPD